MDGKLLRNENIEIGTIKYVASLRIDKKHICNGCLIQPMRVLTTAECVLTFKSFERFNYKGFTVVFIRTENKIMGYKHHPEYRTRNHASKNYLDLGIVAVGFMISFDFSDEINYSITKLKF